MTWKRHKTKLSQLQMEVTEWYVLPRLFSFKLTITKHLHQAMKRLCLQVILLPKAHTQRKQVYPTSPQKPILGLCQGHTRIFRVYTLGIHTHTVKSSQKAFPQSLLENVSRWKAKIVWSPLESWVNFFIILKA